MTDSIQKTIKSGYRSIIVVFTKKSVKNLSIRVKTDKKVYVSLPRYASFAEAEAFIKDRAAFIDRALKRIEQAEKACPPISYISGDRVNVFGNLKTLVVVRGAKNDCFLSGDSVYLSVKEDDERTKKRVFDKFIKSLVESVVGDLCRRYYPFFSRKVKDFPTIKYKSMRSRWGSCTPTKNLLTFNYALIFAPVQCVEYVVVHEFSHFIEFDHSERFYRTVAAVMPDYKVRRDKLKSVMVL
ncbi:MAG: M48 family metallopeptidase [Clostridia bacterium]|nr:M48 family metallopeptidase [Clostridia bacterium]